mgnify:CR=1 FL=1
MRWLCQSDDLHRHCTGDANQVGWPQLDIDTAFPCTDENVLMVGHRPIDEDTKALTG